MSDNLKWLPAEWLDESIPSELLSNPDQYIEKQPDGTWLLCFPVGHYARDEDWKLVIEPGQIVEWLTTEYFGDLTLTIRDDGSFFTNSPVPFLANRFWSQDDWEISADSLKELVAEGDCGKPLEAGEATIGTCCWTDNIYKRFEIDAAGNGRFVDCAGLS